MAEFSTRLKRFSFCFMFCVLDLGASVLDLGTSVLVLGVSILVLGVSVLDLFFMSDAGLIERFLSLSVFHNGDFLDGTRSISRCCLFAVSLYSDNVSKVVGAKLVTCAASTAEENDEGTCNDT
jgi:hypothetical protein